MSDELKLQELRAQFPSVGLTLRGAPALAVLIDERADIPYSAFTASGRTVVVYGLKAANDPDGLWLLGGLSVEHLETRPEGAGALVRVAKADGGTRLTGAQVQRLRELVRGQTQLPGRLSRPSALSSLA